MPTLQVERFAPAGMRDDRVSQKDMRAADDDLAWGIVLADVVGPDRDERLGGRRRAWPAVAVH